MWSCVLRDSDPGITALARANSNSDSDSNSTESGLPVGLYISGARNQG
jgi:hypothetical protein